MNILDFNEVDSYEILMTYDFHRNIYHSKLSIINQLRKNVKSKNNC